MPKLSILSILRPQRWGRRKEAAWGHSEEGCINGRKIRKVWQNLREKTISFLGRFYHENW